jgi:hypothetical protein
LLLRETLVCLPSLTGCRLSSCSPLILRPGSRGPWLPHPPPTSPYSMRRNPLPLLSRGKSTCFCYLYTVCGSGIFISDPNVFHPGSRIFNPKMVFKALGNMIPVDHPGSGSCFLPIPDPGVKKAPDPGSATLFIDTVLVNNIGILQALYGRYAARGTACGRLIYADFK